MIIKLKKLVFQGLIVLSISLTMLAQQLFNSGNDFSNFDSFVKTYLSADAKLRKQIADAYITYQKAHGGFPIVNDDGRVIFLYRTTEPQQVHNISVIGEFRTTSFYMLAWDQAGEALRRFADDSDIYFAKIKLEPDARIEYQFNVDGQKQLDVLNPRKTFNGVANAEVSELVMPHYPLPTQENELPKEAKGAIHPIHADWMITSVQVYLPASYDSSKSYSVVYTADGSAWQKYIGLPEILDRLIFERVIEPIIVVMVDPTADRSTWYLFNPEYLRYMEKVVQFIDRQYSTKADAHHRLHLGTSAGGRASLYAGFERPDLFLNIAMLSPSLTGSLSYFEPYFSGKKQPPKDLKIWLSAGYYEGSLQQDTQTMERYFQSVGISVKGNYTREGHSFQAWRYQAMSMLKYFFLYQQSH